MALCTYNPKIVFLFRLCETNQRSVCRFMKTKLDRIHNKRVYTIAILVERLIQMIRLHIIAETFLAFEASQQSNFIIIVRIFHLLPVFLFLYVSVFSSDSLELIHPHKYEH